MSRRCHHGSARHLRAGMRPVRRPPGSPGGTGSDVTAAARTLGDDPLLSLDASTATPLDHAEAIDAAPAAEARDSSLDEPSPAVEPSRASQRASEPRTAAQPWPDRDRRPERDRPPERDRGPVAVARDQPRVEPSSTPSRDPAQDPADDLAADRGATAPQLRRFIKSRAYVPMHELRRRFAISGEDDVVTAVEIDRRQVYVGLPEREGLLLGELLRGGDIGVELSMDPVSPVVVGVYPMRPVSRG